MTAQHRPGADVIMAKHRIYTTSVASVYPHPKAMSQGALP
jgi:hypothetical protein